MRRLASALSYRLGIRITLSVLVYMPIIAFGCSGTSGRDGEDLGGYLVILDIGFDWGNVTKGAAADAAAPLDYVDISFRYTC